MHRRRRGSQQADRVGAELSVLFGSAVRFGRAPVQIEHELYVLVRSLLVRQRPVVRARVLRALVGGHFSPRYDSGAGGAQR